MKKRIITVSAIALAMILLFVAGFLITYPRLTPIKDGQTRYEKALKNIPSSYDLKVEKATTIIVGEKVYEETSKMELYYRDVGTADQRIGLTETIKTSNTTVSVSETYLQDTVYLSVQDRFFSGALSSERTATRYIPAILDNTIYENVNGYRSKGLIQIHFTSPTAAEIWAMPVGGEMLSSSGITFLDNQGALSSVSYTVSYHYGNAEIRKEFDISIYPASETDITTPEDTTIYRPVDYIDGPVLLEKMCGLLLQEQNITATTEEYMFCGAFGDQRTKTEILEILDIDPLEASIDTTISRSNTSHGSAPVITKQYQSFTNGEYTASINNDPAESNPAITDQYMKEYCQNMLLGTLLLPEYITDIQLSVDDDRFVITYQASSDFADIITEDICNTLYGDPTALSSQATGHTVQEITNTVEIDKATGLPIKTSIIYHGYHTIDEVSYPLKYEIMQTYE